MGIVIDSLIVETVRTSGSVAYQAILQIHLSLTFTGAI
jgi:hypothetical protein